MKTKITQLFIIAMFLFIKSEAQFVPAFGDDQMPLNQPIEVTTIDGKVIKGKLKACSAMNHKLMSFKVAPDDGSDNVKFKPDEVALVKMKPSNMQKIAEAVKSATNINKMKDITNIIDCDWIYYETVKMPKSGKSFLMQRLNPGEKNNKLKVYVDPEAKQEASAGFGGMTLTGGKDKSYYIVLEGADRSILAEKKKYKEQMANIYSNCPAFFNELNGDVDWGNFPGHIAFYNYFCN